MCPARARDKRLGASAARVVRLDVHSTGFVPPTEPITTPDEGSTSSGRCGAGFRRVFDRTVQRDGPRCVAPAQLVVDLLTGPGREPSQGEEMLAWTGEERACLGVLR